MNIADQHNIEKLRKGTLLAIIGGLMLVTNLFTLPVMAQGKLAKFGEFSEVMQRTVDHSAWDSFLGSYIIETEDGRTIIRYGEVADGDKTLLKNYIMSLQEVNTAELTKEQAYAYWVNFYNALTVDLIVDNYPLKSIRDLGAFKRGPWDRKLVKLDGTSLSLNNIEHGILRVFWEDPRTHYAVNCASFGCPNLQGTAFTAENTDALLDIGARAYVNHPRGIEVNDRGRVKASSIYNWYKEDFGGNAQGVLEHVRLYSDDDLLVALEGKTKIDSYGYGWSLNEK